MVEEDRAEDTKIEARGEETRRGSVRTAAQVAVTTPAVDLFSSAATKPTPAQIIKDSNPPGTVNLSGQKHASMNWNIPVSSDERLQGLLSAGKLDAGLAAFREHGCAILRNLLERDAVDALYRDYSSRYAASSAEDLKSIARAPAPNTVVEVGDGRFEITVPLSGEFGAPRIFSNSIVRQFSDSLLGKEVHLSSLSVVVSYPGASRQHIHRDSDHLFPKAEIGAVLPVYAINVALPLIDIDIEMGPTGFWPGSHRWPEGSRADRSSLTVEPLSRGDCMIIDYRTVHTGLPNRSQKMRPIAYLAYVRPWFFDEANHRNRIPLEMLLKDYAEQSSFDRKLLTRAFSHAIRRL
jgi:ectoine hydroxylase-related dioxygenase (phytanoyl-CoA dioxygenase family)